MTTHKVLTIPMLIMGYHTENNGPSCLNSLWFQNINWGGAATLELFKVNNSIEFSLHD